MTSSAQSRPDSVAMPLISTALLGFSASWQPAWCSPVSLLWWKAGGHDGRGPESPPRRYESGMDGKTKKRNDAAERVAESLIELSFFVCARWKENVQ